MLQAVKLPKGEDVNEWLAVNTVDFFNELSMLYGTISEYCSKASCPVMQAGDSVKYLWADGVKIKKPIECSAPEYVDYLMSWVESQLNDGHQLDSECCDCRGMSHLHRFSYFFALCFRIDFPDQIRFVVPEEISLVSGKASGRN